MQLEVRNAVRCVVTECVVTEVIHKHAIYKDDQRPAEMDQSECTATITPFWEGVCCILTLKISSKAQFRAIKQSWGPEQYMYFSDIKTSNAMALGLRPNGPSGSRGLRYSAHVSTSRTLTGKRILGCGAWGQAGPRTGWGRGCCGPAGGPWFYFYFFYRTSQESLPWWLLNGGSTTAQERRWQPVWVGILAHRQEKMCMAPLPATA